jgi:hypothetical protein
MAKPKQNKYSRARVRSNARRNKRGQSSRGWVIASIAVVLVGAVLVFASYKKNHDRVTATQNTPPIANKDHWHAYLGVNICGTWEPPVPKFEGRDGSMTPSPQAGIHSHADYLIHDHPFANDEAGKNATLGRYLEYAQSSVSETSIRLWDQWVPGVDKSNGDKCPGSDKPGKLYWKVAKTGDPWPDKPKAGNPADWQIQDQHIVALYFVPEGSKLEQPPGSTEALANISDVNPADTTTTTLPGASSTTAATDTSSTTAAPSTSTSKP